MKGPYPTDALYSRTTPSEWSWENGGLERGREYRVVQAFADADSDQHNVGEQWEFIGSTFSRYDGELTLMVRFLRGDEWKIPLIEASPAQLAVIENIFEYVAVIGTPQS